MLGLTKNHESLTGWTVMFSVLKNCWQDKEGHCKWVFVFGNIKDWSCKLDRKYLTIWMADKSSSLSMFVFVIISFKVYQNLLNTFQGHTLSRPMARQIDILWINCNNFSLGQLYITIIVCKIVISYYAKSWADITKFLDLWIFLHQVIFWNIWHWNLKRIWQNIDKIKFYIVHVPQCVNILLLTYMYEFNFLPQTFISKFYTVYKLKCFSFSNS